MLITQTHFMLQSNPNLVSKTFHLPAFRASSSFPIKWPYLTKINHSSCYNVTSKPFSQMRVECFFMNTRGRETNNHAKIVDSWIVWRSMENVIKVSVITGVVFLFGLLLIYYDHQYALAASGGRMGGRSFSSFSSSSSKSSSTRVSSSDSYSSGSSPSSSESYSSRTSSPKSSSYESYSSQTSSPKSSSFESYSSQTSSPKSSSYESYSTWSSSPEFTSSGSYRRRPKSSSYESYSTHSSSSTACPESANKFGKTDVYFIITLVTIVCVIVYFLNRSDAASRSSAASRSGTASQSGSATQSGVASRSDAATQSDAGEDTVKTSVLKLQVGLLGTAKSLQKDLNGVAEAADTSTQESLSYVLQETAVALLRHPDYCISGYSSVDVRMGVDECEKQFNQISIEERGKLDEETLVNVDNIKTQSVTSQRSSGLPNEYIVVTIIVAAVGIYELPPIKSNAQLKQALQKLASVPSSKIMAAEVLWTPQKEDDSLSEKEMLDDYPLLRPL